MRKIKDPTLFQSIRKFLTEDMPIVRKKSANTVDAYPSNAFVYGGNAA